MSNYCVPPVPPGSSFKAFGDPVQAWVMGLTAGLNRIIQDSDQTSWATRKKRSPEERTSWSGRGRKMHRSRRPASAHPTVLFVGSSSRA